MVVVSRPANDKIDGDLQSLEEKFLELRARASELRRKGKDTMTVEIMEHDFAPKVRMAKATYEQEDIDKVRMVLDELAKELDEIDKGSPFSHAIEMIKDAYEYLRHENINEAITAYNAIQRIYTNLPEDMKRPIYKACLDINKKITKLASQQTQQAQQPKQSDKKA